MTCFLLLSLRTNYTITQQAVHANRAILLLCFQVTAPLWEHTHIAHVHLSHSPAPLSSPHDSRVPREDKDIKTLSPDTDTDLTHSHPGWHRNIITFKSVVHSKVNSTHGCLPFAVSSSWLFISSRTLDAIEQGCGFSALHCTDSQHPTPQMFAASSPSLPPPTLRNGSEEGTGTPEESVSQRSL